jgi:hypothetical protein
LTAVPALDATDSPTTPDPQAQHPALIAFTVAVQNLILDNIHWEQQEAACTRQGS